MHILLLLYRSPKLSVFVFGLFTGLHKGTVICIVFDVLNWLRDNRDDLSSGREMLMKLRETFIV